MSVLQMIVNNAPLGAPEGSGSARYGRHRRYICNKLPELSLVQSIALVSAFAFLLESAAADSGPSSPSTAPVTSPADSSPNTIALPAGFVRLVARDRTAMCAAADQAWVNDVLASAPTGTEPSTRASDLLRNLQACRDSLAAKISSDLDLKDKHAAASFVADTLLPLADHLGHLRVRVIYLVATKADIKRLVVGGWDASQFHFNRVADKIAFNGMVDVSLDGASGESVVPAPFLPEDSTGVRAVGLREDIGRTESGIGDVISREALSRIQLGLAKFIAEAGLGPLHFKLDADWFAAGVAGELSSEYIAVISGARAVDVVSAIARPDPDNPVTAASIDLANPIPPDQLRPGLAGAYGDAFRRRSIAVVAAWVAKAGPDAIGKTFAAIHASPPADGPALLALIRKTTGIDLSSELPPQ
jgi:hypothetical protein